MGSHQGQGGLEAEWSSQREDQGQRLRQGELCGGRGPSALQDREGIGKAFRTCLMGLLTKGDKIIHFRDLASYLAQHRIQEMSSFYY